MCFFLFFCLGYVGAVPPLPLLPPALALGKRVRVCVCLCLSVWVHDMIHLSINIHNPPTHTLTTAALPPALGAAVAAAEQREGQQQEGEAEGTGDTGGEEEMRALMAVGLGWYVWVGSCVWACGGCGLVCIQTTPPPPPYHTHIYIYPHNPTELGSSFSPPN